MDLEKFAKNIQTNLKKLDVHIYSCNNGGSDKHGNVFHMCIYNIYIRKTHFPIPCIEGNDPLVLCVFFFFFFKS